MITNQASEGGKKLSQIDDPMVRAAAECLLNMGYIYRGAMKEAEAKLETLDGEFRLMYAHNPIHHMESRMKTPQSIAQKLRRKGLEFSTRNISEHIRDIAGIRVICSYIDDVYSLAEMLERSHEMTLLKKSDYIKEPKESGYRSLHLILEVPVSLSQMTVPVPVEIQLRTIAMDMWASLEHEMNYKSDAEITEQCSARLHLCSERLADIDNEMQEIFKEIMEHRSR